MQSFVIQQEKKESDGIGGNKMNWKDVMNVDGYLDLITGTNLNPVQNAFIEDSTHILIIPEFTTGIEDDMRIVDQYNRSYSITYVDDPVGVGHHNEIYCKYSGDVIGEG